MTLNEQHVCTVDLPEGPGLLGGLLSGQAMSADRSRADDQSMSFLLSSAQSFAHLVGDPEHLVFKYTPPAFEQEQGAGEEHRRRNFRDEQRRMTRVVDSFTRGIRMQLALRDASRQVEGYAPAAGSVAAASRSAADGMPDCGALSNQLRAAVANLVQSQVGAAVPEVQIEGGEYVERLAVTTLRLRQADAVASGAELKRAATTEKHVAEHVSALFSLARLHVRVHAVDVQEGFVSEALVTIELPEWAAWVLYTYLVGQRRDAAAAEARPGGPPCDGVAGLGNFLTQDLALGEVCSCSLRSGAQHMSGADILSDSATMYPDTQESRSSSDGEWQASGGGGRRPDFGGSADGSGLAKPKAGSRGAIEFAVGRGPGIGGATGEWKRPTAAVAVAAAAANAALTATAVAATAVAATDARAVEKGSAEPAPRLGSARVELEAGLVVDKKNRRGRVQSRQLFLVGDTLWVGRSKSKATKSFPLAGAFFQRAGSSPLGDERGEHWLRICRRDAARGPKGFTVARSVSTMRVELRGQGDDAPRLLQMLTAVAEEFYKQLQRRAALQKMAEGSEEWGLERGGDGGRSASLQRVSIVGSPVGAATPTFLEGTLEKKSRWLKRWGARVFTLHGRTLSYVDGGGQLHCFEIKSVQQVPQRVGKRQHRFNLTARPADSSSDEVLELSAQQAHEMQAWVGSLAEEIHSTYLPGEIAVPAPVSALLAARLQDTGVAGTVTRHINATDERYG